MYNETTRLVKVVMPDYGQDEPPVNGGGNHPILYSVNQIQPSDPVGGGAIMLSDTAENLYIAYEVVAMVKDESTGKTHFSQLRWKKLGEIEIDGGDAKSVADPSGDGDGEAIVANGAMRYDAGSATEEETPLYYQFMFESGDLFVAAAADEYPALDGDELQMLSDSSSGGGSGGSGGGGVNVVHGTVTEDNGVPIRCVLDKTVAEIAAMDDFVVAAEYESGGRVYGRPLTLTDTDLYIVGLSLTSSSPNAEDMFTFLSAADNPTWTASGGGPK